MCLGRTRGTFGWNRAALSALNSGVLQSRIVERMSLHPRYSEALPAFRQEELYRLRLDIGEHPFQNHTRSSPWQSNTSGLQDQRVATASQGEIRLACSPQKASNQYSRSSAGGVLERMPGRPHVECQASTDTPSHVVETGSMLSLGCSYKRDTTP